MSANRQRRLNSVSVSGTTAVGSVHFFVTFSIQIAVYKQYSMLFDVALQLYITMCYRTCQTWYCNYNLLSALKTEPKCVGHRHQWYPIFCFYFLLIVCITSTIGLVSLPIFIWWIIIFSLHQLISRTTGDFITCCVTTLCSVSSVCCRSNCSCKILALSKLNCSLPHISWNLALWYS